MSAYVTKALYLGRPEEAEKLLAEINQIRGARSFAQFVVEAIREKLQKEK